MNIYINIEKLITYARLHLLLDDEDCVYVRNLIMQKIGLTDYEAYEVDEDELEEMQNPFEMLDVLYNFAATNGLKEERSLFYAEIMDYLSLRPGEMAVNFDNLNKNLPKALEFVCDYAVKSGATFTDFRRWENKGDKNMDVFFASCCKREAKYPACCKCVETEGYGVSRNVRFVPIELGGKDLYLRSSRKAFYPAMCEIVTLDHRPATVDRESLEIMFDFIERAPSWYIASGDCKHAHFKCGSKLLPVHKSVEKAKYKSKEYPYISVVETDWYLNTLRLSCTNREKLIEFVLKLIGGFKGKTVASVRKSESKFVVDLIFVSDKNPKPEHIGVVGNVDMFNILGVFKIDDVLEAQLKSIEKFLTKEVRFTPACLSGELEVHAVMIDALLKEVGQSQLGNVEAALDVKEAVKKNMVACLTDIRAFDNDLKEFLGAIDIA